MRKQFERINERLWAQYDNGSTNGRAIFDRMDRAKRAYSNVINNMADAYNGRKGAYREALKARKRGVSASKVYYEMDTYPENNARNSKFWDSRFGYKQRGGIGKWNSETLIAGLNKG